jgi:hypothetical protein
MGATSWQDTSWNMSLKEHRAKIVKRIGTNIERMTNTLTSKIPRGFNWVSEQFFGFKFFRDLPTGFHSQQHQSDVQHSAYITHSDSVVQF